MQVIEINRRRVGRTRAACSVIADQLKAGQTVGLMDDSETAIFLERHVWILLDVFNVHVVITPMYRITPHLPFTPTYDRFGEIDGVRRVVQVRKRIGFILRQFDIDNDWHPNETI